MVETTSLREEKPKLSARDRLCLIQTINALPPTQFDELVFALNPPKGVVSSNTTAQGQRSKELLDWLEGSSGPGLAAADEVLQVLIPKATKTAPQPVAFVMMGRMGDLTPIELEAIAELLRQKTGDTSIALAFSREGSIKLILNGSPKGLAKLKEAFESGKLEQLNIPPVEAVTPVDSSIQDARKTRLIQALRLSCGILNLALDLDRTLDLACTLDLAHALALDRARALDRDIATALDRDIATALDLTRDLAAAITRDHDHNLATAIARNRNLAAAIARDRNLARGLTRDLARGLTRDRNLATAIARNLARDIASKVKGGRTRKLATAIARDRNLAHDLALALARDLTHDLTRDLTHSLSGSDLSGANLREINLTGVDLTGANLTHADVTGRCVSS